jgi:hypothetical protein
MTSERLQELVELYVGEEITGADAAELRELIETDPAALDYFASEARLALVIAAQLRVGAGMSLSDRVRSVSEADRPSRRARMVRSIAARTRGARRAFPRPVVLAMAALLVIAVVSLIVANRIIASPSVAGWQVNANGSGQLLRDGKPSSIDATMVVHPGDEIVVRGSGSVISAPDGSSIALRPGTRIRLDSESLVAVLAGSLSAEIVHRPGQRMRFTAADTQVEIIGTTFSFGFVPSGIGLEVERGSVAFSGSHGQQALIVTGGQRALAQPRRAPRIIPPPATSSTRTLIPTGDLGRWAADASRGSLARVDRATDGRGADCVRFTATLVHASGIIPWATLTTAPLSLGADDRALRLPLRVVSAGPSSNLCLDLTDRAGDVWRIAQWPISGSEVWSTETVPLTPTGEAPTCVRRRSTSPTWDPRTVITITLVAFGDSSVSEIGEVGVHGR